jgi:hypothetical protein
MIIRTAMMQNEVRGWQVAKYIFHTTEPTYYRKMRDELPDDEQRKIAAQIEAYAIQRVLEGKEK